MTCRDCMWCDVCKSRVMQFGYDFDENKDVPNFGCGVVAGGFKNKADFVEVPCRCSECEHLEIINKEPVYAECKKQKLTFLLWQADTREHFCSYGERREE